MFIVTLKNRTRNRTVKENIKPTHQNGGEKGDVQNTRRRHEANTTLYP